MKKGPITPIEFMIFKAFWDAGYPVRKIAEKLERPATTILSWSRRFNVKQYPRGRRPKTTRG